MYNRALVILAGGSSRRFQSKEGQWSDKALMTYKGKPLLVHLLNDCEEFYDKIGISVNSHKRRKTYSKIIESETLDVSIEYIIDSKKNNFEGVLKGIQSSMSYFVDKEIQFIPSDRPHLLFEILDKLKVEPNGASILQYSDGLIEPLLVLYGPKSRIPPQFHNLSLSRADVPIRLAQSIQSYNIDTLVEQQNIPLSMFANINVQVNFDDSVAKYEVSPDFTLHSPKPIVKHHDTLTNILDSCENIIDTANSLIEHQHYYASFLLVLSASKRKIIDSNIFKKLGKKALSMEGEYWKSHNIQFLELHALQDLIFHFPEEQTKDNMSSMLKLKEKMKIKPRRV
jgi:molybdopterin-guanine dinucleotide biosynthesis protein A